MPISKFSKIKESIVIPPKNDEQDKLTREEGDKVLKDEKVSKDEFNGLKRIFEQHQQDFSFQKSISNWTFVFIIAIVIICFTSFIVFIFDAWKLHNDREKEYLETIRSLKHDNDVTHAQLLLQIQGNTVLTAKEK